MRDEHLPAVLGPLDQLLAGREYLEGGTFSAADIALACVQGQGCMGVGGQGGWGGGELCRALRKTALGCRRRRRRRRRATNACTRSHPAPPPSHHPRSHLLWLNETESAFDLSPYPNARAYMERCAAGPRAAAGQCGVSRGDAGWRGVTLLRTAASGGCRPSPSAAAAPLPV